MIASRKQHWKLLAVVMVVGLSLSCLALMAAPASADHCPSGVTGTPKDHLPDGSCGFWVYPVPSPSPSSTPTPAPTLPVRVENEPRVKPVNPLDENGNPIPLRVFVSNFRQFAETQTEGWNDYDRDVLEAMAEQQNRTHLLLVLSLGLVVFSLAGLLVFTVRRTS